MVEFFLYIAHKKCLFIHASDRVYLWCIIIYACVYSVYCVYVCKSVSLFGHVYMSCMYIVCLFDVQCIYDRFLKHFENLICALRLLLIDMSKSTKRQKKTEFLKKKTKIWWRQRLKLTFFKKIIKLFTQIITCLCF